MATKSIQTIVLNDPYVSLGKIAIDPEGISPYTRPLRELVLLYARDVLLMKEDQYTPKELKNKGLRILKVGKTPLLPEQEKGIEELLGATNFCINHCQYSPLGEHAARADLPSMFSEHLLVLEKFSQLVGRTLGEFRVIESRNSIAPDEHRWMRTPDAISKKIGEAQTNERFWR